MTRTFSTPRSFYYWIAINAAVLVVWILMGLVFPFVKLSENQTLYIYSSIAQVVAGIFGLTITGYIFLRNQQDRLVDKDDSLAEIFDRMQGSQHRLVQFITLLSAGSIFSSLLAITLREVNYFIVTSVILNFSTVLFASVILWTGYFVAEVTRPENVAKISESIKEEIAQNSQKVEKSDLDETPKSEFKDDAKNFGEEGNSNFVQFLSSFNEFEQLLADVANAGWGGKLKLSAVNDSVMLKNNEFEKNARLNPRWPISKLIKMLASEGMISLQTSIEASDMIRYRNALVHGQGFSVDRIMLEQLKDVLKKLREELGKDFRSDRAS